MKIKFTRSVAVYGEHREEGSTHEIADKDALVLIADGAATPAKSTPETAAAKPAAKETAARK